MKVSDNLTLLIRSSETGNKIGCSYLSNPILLSNKKFDLRFFVVLSSLWPSIQIYAYNLFLIRIAQKNYSFSDFEGNFIFLVISRISRCWFFGLYHVCWFFWLYLFFLQIRKSTSRFGKARKWKISFLNSNPKINRFDGVKFNIKFTTSSRWHLRQVLSTLNPLTTARPFTHLVKKNSIFEIDIFYFGVFFFLYQISFSKKITSLLFWKLISSKILLRFWNM